MKETLCYDHYKVLGIPRTADREQIKRAYRTRVMRCHPDRDPSPGAVTVFRAVHEAYEVLSDPARRSRYDERLQHYRTVDLGSHSEQDRSSHSTKRSWTRTDDEIDHPVGRFAYVGLHVTGLLFGTSLILSLITGIAMDYMPLWTLVFSLPGVLAIPTSLEGLRG